jgi:transcriptional regulator with PAS, ATPase and Fis domain
MSQNRYVRELVDAFLEKDQEKALRAQAQINEEPLVLQARAIHSFLQLELLEDSYSIYTESETSILLALEKLPEDSELLVVVAHLACYILSDKGATNEASRLLNYVSQFPLKRLRPEVQALYYSSWNHFYLATHGASKQQIEALSKTTSLSLKPGSLTWCLIQTDTIEACLRTRDYERVQQNLEDLKNFRHVTPWQGAGPYEFLSAWFCYALGRLEEGVAFLESYSAQKMRWHGANHTKLHIKFLLKLQRFDKVKEILDGASQDVRELSAASLVCHRHLTTLDYSNLRGWQALAQKDLERARDCAEHSLKISAKISSNRDNEIYYLLLIEELASKRSVGARVILHRVDPDMKSCAVEWARLFLLEDNREEAISTLKKLIDSGKMEFLKERLRYAYELSAFQILEVLDQIDSHFTARSKTKASTKKAKTPKEENEEILVGDSNEIKSIRQKMEQFAALDTAVLISGETGVGKEVVAKLLHQLSQRSHEPFIAVNCGAISDTLIESELFGHMKGTFTGAEANREGLFMAAGKGTIFLDEVSSMSPHLQSALLRVLEEGEIRPVGSNRSLSVNARVIAATNEPLDQAVLSKKFRMDLYFRLARIHIHIPPLRSRTKDIPILAKYFFKKLYGSTDITLSEDFIAALKAHSWPGNVRELKNEIEYLALTSGGDTVFTASMFQKNRATSFLKPLSPSAPFEPTSPALEPPNRRADDRIHGLKNLFRERHQLTRADIIRLTHCAPNTATKDLRILEKENFIKRINTSSHVRTSYFVLSEMD